MAIKHCILIGLLHGVGPMELNQKRMSRRAAAGTRCDTPLCKTSRACIWWLIANLLAACGLRWTRRIRPRHSFRKMSRTGQPLDRSGVWQLIQRIDRKIFVCVLDRRHRPSLIHDQSHGTLLLVEKALVGDREVKRIQ